MPHGCPADVRHAILSDPPYAPGGGRYAGFFVAPVAADYAFTGYFDTGAELWLSENGDPRLAALAGARYALRGEPRRAAVCRGVSR